MAHTPVRALSRGLAMLAELSAGGPSTAQVLANRANLNRTTVYRLLETLRGEGYVAYEEATGRFSPTPHVRRLSDGLTVRDATSQAALPAMFELLRVVGWPSDFAVFEAGSMIIRESTHPYSAFSVHRSMIGRRRSLIMSALGRAILAEASPPFRQDMLDMAAARGDDDGSVAQDRGLVEQIVSGVKRRGYASSVGETERNISAIAVPVRAAGQVVGSLNIIFFSSSMSPDTAATRYLAALRTAALQIEERLAELPHGRRADPSR